MSKITRRRRNPLTRNQKIGIGVGLTAVVVVGGVVVYRRVTKEEPKDDDDTDDTDDSGGGGNGGGGGGNGGGSGGGGGFSGPGGFEGIDEDEIIEGTYKTSLSEGSIVTADWRIEPVVNDDDWKWSLTVVVDTPIPGGTVTANLPQSFAGTAPSRCAAAERAATTLLSTGGFPEALNPVLVRQHFNALTGC